MPLTKQQFIELHKEKVDLYIEQASHLLRKQKELPINISTELLQVPFPLHGEFMAVFRDAGWNVKYLADGRVAYWNFS